MTDGRLAITVRALRTGARSMIGIPSYDAYLAHMAEHHPEQERMNYAQFFRNRQDARYGVGGKGGFRCC